MRLGTPTRPLSVRRVIELANEGRIQFDRARDDETGRMQMKIQAGSVERFIFERESKILEPAVRNCGGRGPHDPQQLVELALMVRSALSAPSARLWLTLNDSVDYSGLPAAILVQCIADGKLKAMDVGRRRGGRWRIRRSDLEQFDGGI